MCSLHTSSLSHCAKLCPDTQWLFVCGCLLCSWSNVYTFANRANGDCQSPLRHIIARTTQVQTGMSVHAVAPMVPRALDDWRFRAFNAACVGLLGHPLLSVC